MAIIGSLVTTVTANTTQFKKKMKSAVRTAKKFGSAVKNAAGMAVKFGAAITALAGVRKGMRSAILLAYFIISIRNSAQTPKKIPASITFRKKSSENSGTKSII